MSVYLGKRSNMQAFHNSYLCNCNCTYCKVWKCGK